MYLVVIIILFAIEIIALFILLARNKWAWPKRYGDEFSFESRHQYDPIVGYRFFPECRYGNLLTGKQGFILNDEFFSNSDYRCKDRIRIYMFGGSTVAGTGVSNVNKTLPAILEKKLRERFSSKIDVFNFGVGGYATSQEIVYLTELIRHRPDMVITYNGWNDCAYPMFLGGYLNEWDKNNSPLANNECSIQFRRAVARLNAGKYELYGFIFDPLKFMQSFYTVVLLKKFFQKLGKYRGFTEYLANTASEVSSRIRLMPQDAANLYISNVKAMKGICMGFEIPCYSFLQPILLHKAKLTEQESVVFKSRDVLNGGGRDEIVKFYDHVVKLNNENSSPLIDLSNILGGGEETLFLDECHVNDSGNELIAESIFLAVEGGVKCLLN